jgi:hypothetical protein
VKDMDNKPIAWMQMTDKQCITKISFVQTWADDVPLYTHPAKTLTDEEIRHLQAQCHLKNVGYDTFIMRFARAILRKAQEK